MNLPPSAQQMADPQCFLTHLDQVIRRKVSYTVQYIGLQKYKQAISNQQKMQEINLKNEDQEQT
jgi:hypothetical protein